MSDESEDPIERIKRGIYSAVPREPVDREHSWTVMDIGGVRFRAAPHGNLTVYEIMGDDILITMSNAVDQEWADLAIDVGRDATVALTHTSLQADYEDEDDGSVYLSFGMDADDPDMYPLVELRMSRRIALYVFGALFTLLEGEPEE